MDILNIIGRESPLFERDLLSFNDEIEQLVQGSRFLVIGGGGSIGQAVTKELFKRKAKALHVVDLSENYLVELVRDIRSSLGYLVHDFDTFALDCGDESFEKFMAKGKYDYVLNLSAMKHVRSENNPFSMMRMVQTNIFNTLKTYNWAESFGAQKYFCVSTDKAANPANFMGATKRAMEICLMRESTGMSMSGARFANVAFSNGSLLEGFTNRIKKQQPLSTPSDITRFFVTPEESGIICLFATMLGERNEIFFPYNDTEIKLNNFKEIAVNFLAHIGKEAVVCTEEEEAKSLMKSLDLEKYWPVNVFKTDTAGEKPFEEFYTSREEISYGKFTDLASIKFISDKQVEEVSHFSARMNEVDLVRDDAREELIEIMRAFVPTFSHVAGSKFLNSRM